METNAKQEKLIVWEPDGSGHRFMYVRHIAEFALAHGIPFQTQTTLEARALPEWSVQGLDSYSHGISESLAELARLISRDTDAKIQIIVPDSDRWLLKVLGQWKSLHNIRITLLIMRPLSGRSISSKLNHLAKLALLTFLRLTFSRIQIFALTIPGMQLPLPYRALGIQPLFDPVEWNPSMNRSELGLSPDTQDKTIFLVAGELSERKYISEIIHAWDSVQPDKALLVMVGKISPSLEVEINDIVQRNTSILYISEYVSSEIFDSWISAADFVFILHRNPGSSGIAIKASHSNTTIIFGGIASHVSNIRAMNQQHIELSHVSATSISNVLRNPKNPKTSVPLALRAVSPSEWAHRLVNPQTTHP